MRQTVLTTSLISVRNEIHAYVLLMTNTGTHSDLFGKNKR